MNSEHIVITDYMIQFLLYMPNRMFNDISLLNNPSSPYSTMIATAVVAFSPLGINSLNSKTTYCMFVSMQL